jgi:predicted CXXCH cytochrome family protein
VRSLRIPARDGQGENYDPATRSYASTRAEIGVGCEACHGPGAAHVAWAEGAEIARGGAELDAYGFTMDFGDTEAAIQQCAGCHSRREPYGDGSPLPGTPYHDAYGLSLLWPGLYHADRQILDEVYVYGSFLQSRMYAQRVGCMDCHDPHTAVLRAEGNAVCTRCHSLEGDAAFPQAAGSYDTPAHHFHEPGSEAAQCTSCHMAERIYMGVDGRRDHSFRIPRPDLAGATGAPDACTDCHQDREAEWAAETIRRSFPDNGHRRLHYGVSLARGRADAVAAAGDLADTAADDGQPGIVRATALWLLEQANSASTAERLAPLLTDPDPLVRAAAASLQRTAPPQERLPRIARLLDDPVRSVRIAAARAMLGAPMVRLPAGTEAVFMLRRPSGGNRWRTGSTFRRPTCRPRAWH